MGVATGCGYTTYLLYLFFFTAASLLFVLFLMFFVLVPVLFCNYILCLKYFFAQY